MMKEWNITWDCLIALIGGGDCDTDEEIKKAVGYYLKKVFGLDDIDVLNMKIRKYKKYVNAKYNIIKKEEKPKIYIKRGQQLGLPNEKFYEVPYDASDEMLLDIQRWWEGK